MQVEGLSITAPLEWSTLSYIQKQLAVSRLGLGFHPDPKEEYISHIVCPQNQLKDVYIFISHPRDENSPASRRLFAQPL